ncbi:hypothetical protein [Pseudomonas sichuanensis]|uniref:Phasin protein n=1 Tax=Pseudomonas sichuanensis TaxID=2213015 RepID=A0ABV0DF39_9PSED
MATIETEVFAKGLLQVEACWQTYIASQRLTKGLRGQDLSGAVEIADRNFRSFQNQSQQFYAEVRKRVADAEKLERDMVMYPHHYLPKP